MEAERNGMVDTAAMTALIASSALLPDGVDARRAIALVSVPAGFRKTRVLFGEWGTASDRPGVVVLDPDGNQLRIIPQSVLETMPKAGIRAIAAAVALEVSTPIGKELLLTAAFTNKKGAEAAKGLLTMLAAYARSRGWYGRQPSPEPPPETTSAADPGGTLTQSDVFRMFIADANTYFCDGGQVSPELKSPLTSLAGKVDPSWRPGSEATPRLRVWLRLASVQGLLGDLLPKLQSQGATPALLEQVQHAAASTGSYAQEAEPMASESRDDVVVGGAHYLAILAQALPATVAAARGLPTPFTALSLERGGREPRPRFDDQQEETDYWSERTLQAFLALQALVESVGT